MNNPLDRWGQYVNSLVWEKGHLDESSHFAFLRAASLHIPAETAMGELVARIAAAGDHPNTGKLSRQYTKACAYAGAHPGNPEAFNVPPKPEKPAFRLSALARLASNIQELVTPEYLEARSPITCWNRSPAGFLHKLYLPGEKVVVFNVFESQGCAIWEHKGIGQNLSTLNWLQSGQLHGVWFLANPVDGEYYFNPRENKQSRRSEESITAWRYGVLESDDAPAKSWLRVLVQLPLPIAAIYESGDRSIHALVLVNAICKEDWDIAVRKDLGPALATLGICMGSLTAVRLSRLPNCMRMKTGKMQRLLYLNPNPEEIAICQMPVLRDYQPPVGEHYANAEISEI
jgi:hypothetical protein